MQGGSGDAGGMLRLGDAGEPEQAPETLSARALRVWTAFAQEPLTGLIHAPGDTDPDDAEMDAVVGEFGGDLRAVIRALLHDLAVLASDFASAVSRGYVRGGVSEGGRRVAAGRRSATGP